MGMSERYKRQIPVDGWGDEAQEHLRAARVGIAGAGGLGSPVATYLTAAGIGTLVICDYQEVELSNLNRQVVYGSEDIGQSKADSMASRLVSMNPHVEILPVKKELTESNSRKIFGGCNLIIDCLDNWPTRLILNQLSLKEEIPFIHGGIREHWGQFGLFSPPDTACLSCFLGIPEEPDTDPIPVYGAVAGIIGSFMAATALRYLGKMEPVRPGVLHLLDTVSMSLETVAVGRRNDCPVCGSHS